MNTQIDINSVLSAAIAVVPSVIGAVAMLLPTLRSIHTAVNSNYKAMQEDLEKMRIELKESRATVDKLVAVYSSQQKVAIEPKKQ